LGVNNKLAISFFLCISLGAILRAVLSFGHYGYSFINLAKAVLSFWLLS
jgi:hypothetical protein